MLAIEEKISGIQKDILLSQKSYYKTGGRAKYYCVADNESQMRQAIMAAQEIGLPFLVIGKASNILFSDQGFDGLIIEMSGLEIEKVSENSYRVWAGTKMSDLIKFSLENNLTGLEWSAGLPGTIGGAVCGNAGAYGHEMSGHLEKIVCFDTNNLKIVELDKKDCLFQYRQSVFKEKKDLVVLYCFIILNPSVQETVAQEIKRIVGDRNQRHQYDFPTAGCVFKNPKNQIAGALIDQCGLKGRAIGGARVSLRHANFIENFNQATSQDIFLLTQLVKQEVEKKFGIILELENIFVGKF